MITFPNLKSASNSYDFDLDFQHHTKSDKVIL